MDPNPIQILDPVLLKQILLTMAALFSCFMGLWIYRSAFNAMGFLVGIGYAAYMVLIFLPKTPFYEGLSDIQFLLVLVGAMLVGGVLGAFITRIFEAIVFFLAGGIIALVLARLWVGTITPEDLRSLSSFRDALTTSTPQCWEFGAFFVGGILYIINKRIILAITTAALGGLCIRWVWGDVLQTLYPHGHDLAAAILMAIGTIVQMRAFKGKRELLPPRFRGMRFNK